MSKDSGPTMPLEQKCIRPGLWLIEGYTVMRVQHGGGSGRMPSIVRWEVKGSPGRGGSAFEKLSEAREWIREQLGA